MKGPQKFNGLFMMIFGLLILCTTMVLKHYFINFPDFLYGLGFGAGFGLELIGIFSIKRNISKFRKFKV